MGTSPDTSSCAGAAVRGCCGSSRMRIRTNPPPDDLIALLRNAGPALAAANVTLALENHDRFPAATLRGIIESAAIPHAGICLDTANSLGAGEGLSAVTETLAPLTVNLHVKDVRISRLPHMMGFVVEGRPLGAGQLADCRDYRVRSSVRPLRQASFSKRGRRRRRRWSRPSSGSAPMPNRASSG